MESKEEYSRSIFLYAIGLFPGRCPVKEKSKSPSLITMQRPRRGPSVRWSMRLLSKYDPQYMKGTFLAKCHFNVAQVNVSPLNILKVNMKYLLFGILNFGVI